LLGSIKEERAVEPLIKLLNHKYFDARSNAAASLGCIGDSRAIDSLLKRLYKEKEDEVKDCIEEALKSFNNDMLLAINLFGDVIYHTLYVLSKIFIQKICF
jgi:HEAT repeat protein